jgi:hypothetical protein
MGKEKKCTRFWWESPKERDHSEDRGVDDTMESQWILERFTGRVERIQLAQDKDRWRLLGIRCQTFGFWEYGVSCTAVIC